MSDTPDTTPTPAEGRMPLAVRLRCWKLEPTHESYKLTIWQAVCPSDGGLWGSPTLSAATAEQSATTEINQLNNDLRSELESDERSGGEPAADPYQRGSRQPDGSGCWHSSRQPLAGL